MFAQSAIDPGVWIPVIALLAPAFLWAIWLSNKIISNQARLERLITDNTRAMRDVAHYIKWAIEHTTGQKAPPPTPSVIQEAT